jgi:hypothetical protein
MPLLQYALTALLVVSFWKGKSFYKSNPSIHKLLGFTFLLYGISNMVSDIPSVGRFIIVSNLFATAVIIYYVHYSFRFKLFKRLLPLAYACMLFFAIVTIRVGFDFIGLMTVIGNPITALLKGTEYPLIDLIK